MTKKNKNCEIWQTSETLRTEFRVLRNNSRAIEQRLSVDDLARWLTAINRICPGDPKLRKRIVGTELYILMRFRWRLTWLGD